MTKKNISITSALITVLIVSILLPASAVAVPQPPHVFYGAVTIGGSAAADGIPVTAAIAGANFPYTPTAQTSSGRYGDDLTFKVPADDPETSAKEGGVNGDAIVLYVQGVEAGTYTFTIGDVTELNLSISALPTLAAPTNIQRTTPDNDNTPTFTWNAVTNAASYQVRIVGVTAFTDIGNVTTYTFTTVADGSHSFEVRGVDAQGTPGPSGDLYSFTIDTTPPTVAITALTPDPTTDTTPTFTGTATDNTTTIASVQYRIDGGTWTAASAVDGAFDEASESYTFTTSTLSAGSYTVEVRATDAAGNVTTPANYASDSFTVTIAAPAPAAAPGAPGAGAGAAGITSVLGSVTEKGRFTEDVTAKSEDGNVELFIPKDTIGLNRAGSLLSSITIKEMAEPPDPPVYFIIIPPVYHIGPEGATFDPPIDLSIKYDASLIPEGVAEKNLVVATFDKSTSQWVELESTVDPETDTITAKVSHFSAFAVLAPTRPAIFTTTDLSITPTEIYLGESITISVLVTNAGDLTGSYEVSLKIDDLVVEMKEVTLDGGDSETVSFSVTPAIAGEYTAKIDRLQGTFKVKTPLAPAAFTTSTLIISPTEVNTGERVTISVIVTNTGDLTGTYKVTLKIDDLVVEEKEVTVAGGASQRVTFTAAKDIPGTYMVAVNRLTGWFVVKEKVPPVVEEIPPMPPPMPIKPPLAAPINWWLIGGIIAAVIIIGGVAWRVVIARRVEEEQR
ncbi:MAG: Ig-like domain-containing protein [Dehalococcoidales bacterium]